MRLVKLAYELEGEVLGKTIYTADGRVLLRAGTALTKGYISALLRKGYTRVYLQDEFAPDVLVDDALTDQTRVTATAIAKETLDNLVQGHPAEFSKVREIVEQILNEVSGTPELMVGLSAIRNFDEDTFTHSVNVCVLSLILGKALLYRREELVKLGMGALLHDVGKMKIPREILGKPDRLTREEFEQIKTHSLAGYEILKGKVEISLLSAHVALQHHEKVDGSGYPRGLRGGEIHEFARITAIADMFDALTSDRAYRCRVPPHEAARLLKLKSGKHLDERLTTRFLERIAFYPNGTIVRLNNGEVGVVVQQQAGRPERPVVRVMTDAQLRLIPPREINLFHARNFNIKLVLPDWPQQVKDQVRAAAIARIQSV